MQLARTISVSQYFRLLLVSCLGFFSGFPLLLTGATMQAWAVSRGLSLVDVGFLSLLGLPYLVKWLWAPLIDKFQLCAKSRLLVVVQVVIGFSLLCMSWYSSEIFYWQISALFVAFFSATQDLIIDAYRIELLESKNYGIGAALSSVGYRIGMILAGGIGLILVAKIGWQNTYILAALVMFFAATCCVFFPEIVVANKVSFSVHKAWADLLSKKHAAFWLVVVFFYRFSDVVVANLGSAFLIQYCNLSIDEVGLVYKVAGVIATIFGSIIAGLLIRKYELKQMLLLGAILQCVGFVPFVILANIQNFGILWCYFAVAVESICAGFALTCLLALLMDWCNELYLTTQFAWLSALVAVPRVFMGGLAGYIVSIYGWSKLFLLVVVVAMIVVFMLAWIRTKEGKV